ncbi:hypothetical protein ACMATS_14220 [Streptoverticillium reticulum]|uniref:hypothetical protein n=1 Tax=Streptoverticillium reticulum TaxID=1433415 RepID=UPI0039BFCA80
MTHTRSPRYLPGGGTNSSAPVGKTLTPGNPARWRPDPYRGLSNDPPVSRVVREPASTTVADIRKQYGMVFKLDLDSGDYYKVFKPGKAPGH